MLAGSTAEKCRTEDCEMKCVVALWKDAVLRTAR